MRVLFPSNLPQAPVAEKTPHGIIGQFNWKSLQQSCHLDSGASVECWSGTAELLLPPFLPAQSWVFI